MKRIKEREQRGGLHLLTDDSQKKRDYLEIKLKDSVAEVLLIISHVHENCAGSEGDQCLSYKSSVNFDTTNSFLSMQRDQT